jgi:hypothetical protein
MTPQAEGLFPSLMGSEFSRLAPAVRAVHGGRSHTLHGQADVVRGKSLLAQVLCLFGRLAQDQARCPVRVEIEANGNREVWTRHFGSSPRMRSVLSARDGTLCERFGPAALQFSLRAEEGCVAWRPVKGRVLGMPVPAKWLAEIHARAFERAGVYVFEVKVALPRVGTIIEYRGQLESSPEQPLLSQ